MDFWSSGPKHTVINQRPQSSTFEGNIADRAMDEVRNTDLLQQFYSHTDFSEPWGTVDLQSEFYLAYCRKFYFK